MTNRELRKVLAGLIHGMTGVSMFFAFVMVIDKEIPLVLAALCGAVATSVLASMVAP